MHKVPSKSSRKLAAIILKGAGVSAGAVGYYTEEKYISLLALQIDIAASLVNDGHLTPASLATALAQEGLGIATLSEDHRITCGVAVILATNSASEFTKLVAEAGETGPAMPLMSSWIAASGAAALSDLYGAYDECKPVAQEGIFAIGGALDQMDSELTQWAVRKDLGFGF